MNETLIFKGQSDKIHVLKDGIAGLSMPWEAGLAKRCSGSGSWSHRGHNAVLENPPGRRLSRRAGSGTAASQAALTYPPHSILARQSFQYLRLVSFMCFIADNKFHG